MTTLGSGKYRIEIAPSGSFGNREEAILELDDFKALRWTRKLDGISTARVDAIVSPSCFTGLCDVRTVWNELRIIRDPGGIVWEGPIVVRKTTRRRVQLAAFDLAWWLQRRFIPDGVLSGQTLDVAEIGNELVSQSLLQEVAGQTLDPAISPYIQTRNVGLFGAPTVDGESYRYAFEELRTWATTELDWTMIKRSFLAGNPPTEAAFPELTLDDIIGDPVVTERGDLYATDVVVIGGDGVTVGIATVEGVLGIRVPGHLRAQVREIVEPVSDQATLQQIAEEIVRLRYPSPIDIDLGSGSAISPKSEVCIDQLIPGATGVVDVTGYCTARTRQLSELTELKVSLTEKGEKVAAAVRPVTTVAA